MEASAPDVVSTAAAGEASEPDVVSTAATGEASEPAAPLLPAAVRSEEDEAILQAAVHSTAAAGKVLSVAAAGEVHSAAAAGEARSEADVAVLLPAVAHSEVDAQAEAVPAEDSAAVDAQVEDTAEDVAEEDNCLLITQPISLTMNQQAPSSAGREMFSAITKKAHLDSQKA